MIGARRRGAALRETVLILPALAWLGVLFVFPIGRLFYLSLFAPTFTLRYYAKLVSADVYLKILVNSFEISLTVTLVALVLGYPVAFLLATARPRAAGLLLAAIVLPLWTSVLVRTYAWMVILGRRGVVNEALRSLGLLDAPLSLLYNRLGVSIGMVHVLLPFMILPIYSVLRGLDPRLVTAAQNLGANGWQVFRRVVLPLSLPGAVTGTMFVFILSLGFYITPALLGGPRLLMVATIIDQQVNEMLNWPFAAAMAVVLLGLTLGLVALFTRFVGFEKIYRAT